MKHILYSLFILFSSSTMLFAYPAGITGKLQQASGGCGGCHGASSSNTTISMVSKTGSFTVKPGTKLELTAVVAHPSKVAAGVNIGVKSAPNSNTNIGTLEVVAGQGLKKSASELVQSSPKDISNGRAEFTFTWTAPAQEGTYYLMATGNAVNRNGGDSGDEWNYMQPIQLIVSYTTGIQEETPNSIVNVFPNPLQEYSIIEYHLPFNGNVSYSIINTLGQQVFKQDLGYQYLGSHSTGLSGLHALIPSGQYILSLYTDGFLISVPFIKK